jgi:hypothetical protein
VLSPYQYEMINYQRMLLRKNIWYYRCARCAWRCALRVAGWGAVLRRLQPPCVCSSAPPWPCDACLAPAAVLTRKHTHQHTRTHATTRHHTPPHATPRRATPRHATPQGPHVGAARPLPAARAQGLLGAGCHRRKHAGVGAGARVRSCVCVRVCVWGVGVGALCSLRRALRQGSRGMHRPPHTHTHARAHTLTHTHTQARTHTHTHTHTQARTHARTHARTRTHARARTHARTHTHTHTHTHTRTPPRCARA